MQTREKRILRESKTITANGNHRVSCLRQCKKVRTRHLPLIILRIFNCTRTHIARILVHRPEQFAFVWPRYASYTLTSCMGAKTFITKPVCAH